MNNPDRSAPAPDESEEARLALVGKRAVRQGREAHGMERPRIRRSEVWFWQNQHSAGHITRHQADAEGYQYYAHDDYFWMSVRGKTDTTMGEHVCAVADLIDDTQEDK